MRIDRRPLSDRTAVGDRRGTRGDSIALQEALRISWRDQATKDTGGVGRGDEEGGREEAENT